MAELKELVRKRGTVKGRLTTFINYVNALPKTLSVNESSELQLRTEKADSLLNQFYDTHNRIECLVEEGDLADQVTEREEFEKQFYAIISKAKLMIAPKVDEENYSSCDDEQPKFLNSGHTRGIKLPTIHVPKFSGRYEDWLEFRDTFVSLIHDNPFISAIQKFHYLRASLDGGAAQVIRSLEFSSRNYIVAWELLNDRYNNERLLIQNHVQSLFSIEPMKRESSQSIRIIIDTYTKNIRSLEVLGEPTSYWDTLLIYLIRTKLDNKTIRDWEEHKASSPHITLTEFTSFLKDKADLLETLNMGFKTDTYKNKPDHVKGLTTQTNTDQTVTCPLCQQNHRLFACEEFLSKSVNERAESVRKLKLCLNCLRPGHQARVCRSSKCTICTRPHNTLLHFDTQTPYAQTPQSQTQTFYAFETQPQVYQAHSDTYQAHPHVYQAPSHVYPVQPQAYQEQQQVYQPQPHAYQTQQARISDTNKDYSSPSHTNVATNTATTLSVNMPERVLLSTALIHILDKDNRKHEARAVLDSGSQASFMTESLLNKLQLKCSRVQTSVIGINSSISQTTQRCNTTIESMVSPYKTTVSFLVLPNIASLCNNSFSLKKLNIPSHVTLADPEYYDPSNIDVLLGADIFWDLIEQGQIRLGPQRPILQNTKLGYIVSGPTSGLNQTFTRRDNSVTCNFIQSDYNELSDNLVKFWQLEEPPKGNEPIYSTEERLCEEHFVKNCKRMKDGRFSVAIPLKLPESSLGDSLETAKHCFFALERRLQRLPKLKQMYTEFIKEYKQLDHMQHVQPHLDKSNTQHAYYMPHHGVLRESSTTTKLRAVFNASKPTSNGVSLNDLQMIGPVIQSDLFSILIRFRHYTYVMTGDLEKMYRQVLIHSNQRHLQRIIWRDDPTKPLELYQLNTVTYGTASAPFLAVRCLKQLALECTDPVISEIIDKDFYVDDLVTGSQSAEDLFKIRDNICNILSSGCFNLRKIKSNLNKISSQETDSIAHTSLNLGQEHSTCTLGIGWSSTKDELYYTPKLTQIHMNPTKRSILSTIGQIFDPLGLLSIFIISAKILLQKLWLQKLSWDDPLPHEIIQLWLKFTSQLCHVTDLRLPRHVSCADPQVIELHTFCDSSQDAYGACVYVRSISETGHVESHLLCAKSKVAPLKPVTIPRLELCGAIVAARLTQKVLHAFRLPVNKCVFWTDSSIVLGWLKTTPNKLKQFVKNRVAEVQELTQNHQWRHVPTDQNPADLLTRGVDMSHIQSLHLWWNGPKFLSEHTDQWPSTNFDHQSIVELPEIISANVGITRRNNVIEFNRFSKLLKLKRVFAFILRFIHNCQAKRHKHNKISGPLNTQELNKSFHKLLKLSQTESIEEYDTLTRKQMLPNKNRLLSLTPFTDKEGLIRVGGRLKNSSFHYGFKHPILISCKHPLAKLIFENEHARLLHAPPQLLLSSIRQEFWPLGGRNMARHVVHKCHRCFRMKAQTVNPIMGQLPGCRLSPGYPFETTGVDYAGPLLAADRRGRGCKLIKVYVAVFVCFTTKAIHLELVTELTKDAYIAALRRFIARRSKPSMIFSDNGTQFVGAKNEIKMFLKENSANVSESMANDNIDFRFIPAYAPHFGGLWEAGVKSFKSHLVRILGNSHFTFEELYTSLVQIESILNSRPLTPISPDPNDLTPLTPGHFLVGRPLTALPSPRLDDANPNRLQRWERVEQMRQHFWSRWQKEYVTELQQKVKWRSSVGTLKKDTMVIIKDDAAPPMKWSLGRVVEVHPDREGVVRVADIKTSKGVIRRAFNRICPLPLMENQTTSIDG